MMTCENNVKFSSLGVKPGTIYWYGENVGNLEVVMMTRI